MCSACLTTPFLRSTTGARSLRRHSDGSAISSGTRSIPAIADAADALDVSTTTIGDYSFTSAGNMKRIDGTIDWLQHRVNAVDGAVARQFGVDQSPGVAAVNKVIDGAQWWFWDAYRFSQRVTAEWIDEGVLNTIEDTTDRSINQSRLLPAQIIVDPSQSAPRPTSAGPAADVASRSANFRAGMESASLRNWAGVAQRKLAGRFNAPPRHSPITQSNRMRNRVTV